MTRKLETADPLAPVRTLLERLNLTTAARGLPDLLAQAEATHPAYSAWLKVKPKLTIDVMVAGGSSEPVRWGDWGLAVELQLRYRHPREGSLVDIQQAVRVRRDEPFKLHVTTISTSSASTIPSIVLGYRGLITAYTGQAEHVDRSNVNAPIGDGDRSAATLAGRSAVELALLSP